MAILSVTAATWAMVGIRSAGAVAENRGRHSDYVRAAQQFGMKRAAAESNALMAQEALVAQSANIDSSLAHSKQSVAMAQKQSEAEAAVSAAASGVSGSSVDLQLYETTANAARRTAELENRAKQAKWEVGEQSKAIEMQLRGAEQEFIAATGKGNLLNIFNEGLNAFLQYR